MTFEEFFKKKRIDLAALEKGNPALFFEFKSHFHQMGEKSFDHTKKYWFNNLRKLYHLAAEIKTEKPKIENPLAEQTVTDSLTELEADRNVLGFVPEDRENITGDTPPSEVNKQQQPTAPKPGFTPRFKAAMAKPAEAASEEEKKEDAPASTAPKPGFTPRFKAANMPKPADTPAPEEKQAEAALPEEKPKIGFTPRFKAGVTKPADTAPATEEKKEEAATPEEKPKIGFTPRFKAGVTKPATAESDAPSPEEKKTDENAPAEKPKIGFTPRFKASSPPKQQDPPKQED